jgi:hypothetical protein
LGDKHGDNVVNKFDIGRLFDLLTDEPRDDEIERHGDSDRT